MTQQPYLAHIAPDDREQTVEEHCQNAAKIAEEALLPIGLGKTAYLAGLLHDTGKFKEEFTVYLQKAVREENAVRGSVNHTFAGVRYLLEQWHGAGEEFVESDLTAELLAYAVGGHHGLFDCIDPNRKCGFFYRETKEGIGYEESIGNFLRFCADKQSLDDLFEQSVREITPILGKISQLPQSNVLADEEVMFYIGLLARMLLSAVIEGDRTDTAAFMSKTARPQYPKDMRPIWGERLAFLEQKLSEFPHEKPIDRARQTISETCAAAGMQPGEIFRLNVPTGGGKTLSGLRFALVHGKRWNKSRIIFTSPLLSILDQNAEIIRSYVGDDSLILEFHSNMAEPEETPERLQELELLAEDFRAPIVITTLVQLLNTCFSGKTGAIRRFQALCNSIIVIDEVQTVPGKMLTLFNLAVNFLSEVCGATVVLCSATQPCLEQTCHPLWKKPAEIVPWDPLLWNTFKRTEIQNAGTARLEEIPELVESALRECSSLLVVCNTKAEAAFLFEALKDTETLCFHLSAAMCMAHRRQTLSRLQTALEDDDPLRPKVVCISTQVIEAGVDISFQQVIRFSAGMDSVVQSAGRCNRHAEQKSPAPVRIVQCADERLRFLADITRGQTATNSLLAVFQKRPQEFHGDLASDEAIAYYYRRLYREMNPGFQDDMTAEHGTIYSLLADNPRYADRNCAQVDSFFLRQAFQTAGHLFQVFDEDTTEVLVPYGKGCELRETLLTQLQDYGPKDWETIGQCLREAKGYSISVYHYQWEQLQQLGAVTSLLENSIHILSDGFYDDQTGFSIQTGISGFQEV